MPNERLREAISRSGLTVHDVACKMSVDPKTVERWVTLGRVPYPRHRREIAELVQEGEPYLWPTALSRAQRDQVAESEIVHVYPHRASVPPDHWRRLLEEAKSSIDILMYSGMFLVDQIPRLGELLKRRATEGVRVRVLAGDPDCARVQERGREEGIDDAMAAKVRNVLVQYRPLARAGGAEVRLHATTLYNSIYRFDDDMLVNSHVYGFPAAHAPVLHLRRLGAGILFETYAESFKQIWTSATEAWPTRRESGGRAARG